jgi:hypothetical protein
VERLPEVLPEEERTDLELPALPELTVVEGFCVSL